MYISYENDKRHHFAHFVICSLISLASFEQLPKWSNYRAAAQFLPNSTNWLADWQA
ncbi:hypothetical protein [Moraxella marmotae]|uniref:hypothetical protein n=1 Tax=Moraxella marmotae TaxID=3344520 RepID=UPI0035F33E9D